MLRIISRACIGQHAITAKQLDDLMVELAIADKSRYQSVSQGNISSYSLIPTPTWIQIVPTFSDKAIKASP